MPNHIYDEDVEDPLVQRNVDKDKINDLSTSMAGFTDSLKELDIMPQGESEESKVFMNITTASSPHPSCSVILTNTNSTDANGFPVISVNEQITVFFCFMDTGIELIEFSIWERAF
jgi:hypothetical protein